jgi:riboflavin synthase
VFTGIVSAVGRVVRATGGRVTIEEPSIAAALRPGGSVAVNGACLTATDVAGAAFGADVVPETLSRTNLGRLAPGGLVNLELPMRLDTSVDGHLVQGHVDATVRVRRSAEAGAGREVMFELPPELAPFVAEKGSIAIDGTSLTVAAVDDGAGTFSVALIPATLERTVARLYVANWLVNVEVDLVARYIRRLMTRSIH